MLKKDSHWLSPASLSETECQHCVRRAQLFTPGTFLCFDVEAEVRGYDNANVVTITDSIHNSIDWQILIIGTSAKPLIGRNDGVDVKAVS